MARRWMRLGQKAVFVLQLEYLTPCRKIEAHDTTGGVTVVFLTCRGPSVRQLGARDRTGWREHRQVVSESELELAKHQGCWIHVGHMISKKNKKNKKRQKA